MARIGGVTAIQPTMEHDMKNSETVEQYLARGGTITVLPYIPPDRHNQTPCLSDDAADFAVPLASELVGPAEDHAFRDPSPEFAACFDDYEDLAAQ